MADKVDAISTHAPRTGSDPNVHSPQRIGNAFQPTLPARGATRMRVSMPRHSMRFQPTLPARGATRNAPPRSKPTVFQPTLPARGATPSGSREPAGRKHFNPRSPHGERRRKKPSSAPPPQFQPTLPARGATSDIALALMAVQAFQPTLPARGATARQVHHHRCASISTHAPRTGSDIATFVSGSIATNFNPRSPHGERRRPAPGAENRQCISTHAPRTGSDVVGV